MSKIERVKELTQELLHHSHLYYVEDRLEISDAQYDKLYDELFALENETGFWLANSPTRKVQGEILDGFKKITHSKPMLSAAKTKDVNEIKKFINNNRFYCSYKLDGLTLVVIYEDGKFKQAITRGTGLVGEDVTEQAKMISNLPMSIPYKDRLELRGECVISWEQFNKINETLEEPYSHPRNLAAGTLRQLDTNIVKERSLSYVVFECVSDLYNNGGLMDNKWLELSYLKDLGFEIVPFSVDLTVEDLIKAMTPELCPYPVDGLIFELTSKQYSKSLPSTGHHEGCRMALKWADDMYETILRDVVWQTSRSGIVNPVAVFDEIDLGGALTTRATLHNVSIIEGLELGVGDTITVYRSNMVIPKIDDNLTRSNTLEIPTTCPCCGHKTEIHNDKGSKTLHCTNPDCSAKLLSKLENFCSRKCMNIEGMSEATLEFLIERGWVKSFKDIYYLYLHGCEWEQCEGFGEKSVANILDAIDRSRKVKLENFIAALSIDGIGTSASKTISSHFNGDFNAFYKALMTNFDWSELTDFGEITARNIANFGVKYKDEVRELAKEFNFILPEKVEIKENPFMGKSICVTGKLFNFSRDSINAKITELGAKAVSSVSKNTDYLITNEASGSSKYKKAVELNVPIITEEEFLRMINTTK